MSNYIMENGTKVALEKFVLDNGVNVDNVVLAMIYDFAKKLPYSMDPNEVNFVPGDFLNFKPVNSKHNIFKFSNNLYSKMVSWGDSLKSGVLLEVCFIFQKMLMGEFPNDYQLQEEDYYNMGINNMTNSDEYSRKLFEVIRKLPDYYKKVILSETVEERRNNLERVYSAMKGEIGNKVGGMRKTDFVDGIEVSIVHKASISWEPYRDIEMIYYFNGVNNYGEVDCKPLIEQIRNNCDLNVLCDKEVSKKKSRVFNKNY